MKKLIENNDKDIIDSYLGKEITLFCCRYIYTGKLIKLDSNDLTLEDPRIVYETGAFSDSTWKDAQSLCSKEWSISRQSIESYGELNKK